MRISTFWYCLKQGIINICRNILFSLASMATISACIFLFCLFFAIVANVQNVTQVAQSTVGITVFFADDLPEDRILSIGDEIRSWGEVRDMEYISAEQAWENFKKDYFEGMEECPFEPQFVEKNELTLTVPEIPDKEVLTKLKEHPM